jgi:hypothetical protein
MRVPQSKNKLALIRFNVRPRNLEATEVPLTETRQSVFLFSNGIAVAVKSLQGLIDQESMGDGSERLGCVWGTDVGEFFTGNEVFSDDHNLMYVLRFN